MATKLADNEMMIVHEDGITVLVKDRITSYSKNKTVIGSKLVVNVTYDGQNYRYVGVTDIVHEINKARAKATPKFL